MNSENSGNNGRRTLFTNQSRFRVTGSRILLIAGAISVGGAIAGMIAPQTIVRFLEHLISPHQRFSDRTAETVRLIPLVLLWWSMTTVAVAAVLHVPRNRGSGELPGNRQSKALNILWIVCMGLLLAANLVPIAVFPILPFQDLPTHLLNAHIASSLAANDPWYAAYYRYDFYPVPYLTGEIILRIFAPLAGPMGAAKVLFGLYVIFFPFSVWWYYRRVAPGRSFFVPAACLFTFNFFVLMGNLNFILSFPLFFLAASSWHGLTEKKSAARFTVTAALILLLYFTHLFTWLVFLLYCAATIAGSSPRQKTRAALSAALAFLPAVCFYGMLLLRGSYAGTIAWYPTVGEKISSTLQVMWWTDFIKERLLLIGPVLAVATGIGLGLFRNRNLNSGVRAGFAVLVAAYCFAPQWIGAVGFPDQRLIIFILIIGGSLVPQPSRALTKATIMVFFTVAALVWSGHVYDRMKEWNAWLVPVWQRLETLPPRETAIAVSPLGQPGLHRFGHYYGVLRDGVMPGIFNDPFYNLKQRVVLPGAVSLAEIGPAHERMYDRIIMLCGPEEADTSTLGKTSVFREVTGHRLGYYREFQRAAPLLD